MFRSCSLQHSERQFGLLNGVSVVAVLSSALVLIFVMNDVKYDDDNDDHGYVIVIVNDIVIIIVLLSLL
eukprot:m.61077 g.61077  ORF g.61077 m.61077 type:complete len:69 (+) comp22926_c1_seq1:1231-1437(+)